MKANYVDIIMKYRTYYKGVEFEIINEPVYNLPIFKVTDTLLKTEYKIYFVEDLLTVFKWIGTTRKAYGAL